MMDIQLYDKIGVIIHSRKTWQYTIGCTERNQLTTLARMPGKVTVLVGGPANPYNKKKVVNYRKHKLFFSLPPFSVLKGYFTILNRVNWVQILSVVRAMMSKIIIISGWCLFCCDLQLLLNILNFLKKIPLNINFLRNKFNLKWKTLNNKLKF